MYQHAGFMLVSIQYKISSVSLIRLLPAVLCSALVSLFGLQGQAE
jgi:hypothetical protein